MERQMTKCHKNSLNYITWLHSHMHNMWYISGVRVNSSLRTQNVFTKDFPTYFACENG